jgi:hypothetical protein
MRRLLSYLKLSVKHSTNQGFEPQGAHFLRPPTQKGEVETDKKHQLKTVGMYGQTEQTKIYSPYAITLSSPPHLFNKRLEFATLNAAVLKDGTSSDTQK